MQLLGPSCPCRFSKYYLSSYFFPHTKPGWGAAGEGTGSGTRGLAKVMRLIMGPGWVGGLGDDLLAFLPVYSLAQLSTEL